MAFWWHQLRGGVLLIAHGDPDVLKLLWVTIRLALISTGAAVLIGLGPGLALGLGRFRGRRALQLLANASLALPPVVVGLVVLLLLLPQSPLGGLRIEYTFTGICVAQTILALPYVLALVPAAIQGLPPGLIAQARLLGAGRLPLARLALREARGGIVLAVIAALGAAVSEVGAVAIVGGNTLGETATLASGLLAEFSAQPNDTYETAIGLLLAVLVLGLLGAVSLIGQREGTRLRLRGA